MIHVKDFEKMLNSAAETIISAEQELTDIDSKFGDADHGITMTKIMNSVKDAITEKDGRDFKTLLDDISMSIMTINGGSAVPLWTTLFDGMSSGAPNSYEITLDEFKNIYREGLSNLSSLSKAKVGDKTMMDTLIPAVETLTTSSGSLEEIMSKSCNAAIEGATASEGFVSKFGRAKSYKEQTIGTPDAGAMSMKYFFVGMNSALH